MDRFLFRDAVRLRYRDEGRGDALLLIHGWALTLRMWRPQVEALADRSRIIRMDRRGFGESTGEPNIEADARDLQALLAHLRLDRVAVLGMSQGARVALSLAGIAGDRITCLILDGAPADHRLQLTDLLEEFPLGHYRRLFAEKGIEAVRTELAAHPLMRLHTADGRMRRLARQMLSDYRGSDLTTAAPLTTSADPLPLQRLRLPVLVLTGELDSPQRQRIADAFCAALPRAEPAIVPRAGHLANLDNPEDYNAILADFLERHTSAMPRVKELP